jgi:hypothetical protein
VRISSKISRAPARRVCLATARRKPGSASRMGPRCLQSATQTSMTAPTCFGWLRAKPKGVKSPLGNEWTRRRLRDARVCAAESWHTSLATRDSRVQNNCPPVNANGLTAACRHPSRSCEDDHRRLESGHSASAVTSRMLGSVVIAVSHVTRRRPPMHEHRHSREASLRQSTNSTSHGRHPRETTQGIATARCRP